jgi:Domain of unknown function (DUF4157)
VVGVTVGEPADEAGTGDLDVIRRGPGRAYIEGLVLARWRRRVVTTMSMTRSYGDHHDARRDPEPVRKATTWSSPAPSRVPDGIIGLQPVIGDPVLRRLLGRRAEGADTGPDPGLGAGRPLDVATRQFMESRVGHELGRVRVHTDALAAESARTLGAQAYSVGSHVVFGAGRYDPRTPPGARLLAHELVHVAQARGRPLALRRKPDDARLDVEVPDLQEVTPFTPGVDYAWQNPLIRQSVFPARESAFREFLLEEKGNDLRADLAGGRFTVGMATDVGAEILAERGRLTDELAEHVRLRRQAEVGLRTAQAETRRHLAEPEVRGQQRTERVLASKRNALADRARTQRARITQLEHLGAGIGAGQQLELDRRRAVLEEIQDELTPTAAELAEVSDAFTTGLEPFTGTEAELKAEITGHRTQEGVLRPQLERVSGGVDAKTGRASREAAIRWRLHQFSQQISGMGHDELLGLVLDVFATDKGFTRFTKQERYLIIHFSGMRYASARRTWGPPQELLATLKEQQVRELLADADEDAVEQDAEAAGAQIEAELTSKDTGGPRKAELRSVKKGLDSPGSARTQLFAKKPQEGQAFEELEAATRARTEAVARMDADGVEESNRQIGELEKQIGAPALKRIRARLAEADRKRLETLRDYRIREARQAMNGLSDLDALSVLQAMKDSLPAWVWHEVVRRTQLRVNVAGNDWDDPVPIRSLDRKDPVTARWLEILEHWPREETVSVEKQGEKFEVVATAVVCNQLSEQAQHTYGKRTTQGIRGAVDWYRGKVAQAAGGTGGVQPFFVRPSKEQDFVEGAGLFWAHFEAKKKPYKGNMAHLLGGIDFMTEGGHVIRDGLQEGDWTYRIDPATEDITRTRGQGDTEQTQWFSWQHEATILKRAPGRVITFETSAGARRHSWTLGSLLDPMNEPWIKKEHGDTNVFVGFAPGRDTMPQLDAALGDILPGRGAL